MKNFPYLKIVIGIVIVGLLASLTHSVYKGIVNLHNTSKTLETQYKAVVQKQISNYDGYYLAFTDKQKNAKINKETFIIITDIIMSNRRDGANLAWKWNTENQNIPYQEFSYFYKELSSFINERYGDNMKIEQEKQNIVQQQNSLISKFPNNYYNDWLEIKPLIYTEGFISDYTKDKFKSKY